ncbi:Uncharacterised protein [Staphylococcus gallinarum]|uniref:Uncharacterized protein n=1 Tax=Staphylococcus gallinarum TaxID=1293 RepID=A0A380FLX2_STAGA|nr:Uncharacterised protein [Staphylococcus gallinarum]
MFKKPVPNDDVLDDTPLTQQTYFKMMQDFFKS